MAKYKKYYTGIQFVGGAVIGNINLKVEGHYGYDTAGKVFKYKDNVSMRTVLHDADPRLPSQDENDALLGTTGTPSNTNKFVTNIDPRLYTTYKYNAGSAPSIISNPKIFYGTTTTNSSGVATFEITDNGQNGGNAIFTNLSACVITATAVNNTATLTDVPLVSEKAITNNKTLTFNVVNSAGILLGGQGLEFVGSGISVNVIIIGI